MHPVREGRFHEASFERGTGAAPAGVGRCTPRTRAALGSPPGALSTPAWSDRRKDAAWRAVAGAGARVMSVGSGEFRTSPDRAAPAGSGARAFSARHPLVAGKERERRASAPRDVVGGRSRL